MSAISSRADILVTGATGFLGRSVVARLTREGHHVTALGQRERPESLPDAVDYLRLDLADAEASVRLRPCRWHAIIHLAGAAPKVDVAWDDGAELVASHVCMAATLVGLVPDDWGGRLIHASGFIVYGIPERLPAREDDPRRPLHAYALAKKLAEDVLLLGFGGNIDRWILRLPGLFSETRRSGALYRFAAAARFGDELIVESGRSLPWDVLHVDDAVEMIMRALAAPAHDPGPVNVSYGETVDLLSMARRLAERAGMKSQVRTLGSVQPPSFRMDTTRMESLLGKLPHTLNERLEKVLAAASGDAS